jgi:hypothetical protein
MIEQGLSFTVIFAPCPRAEDPDSWDGRRDFETAQRVWLGYVRGTDWLHDAAERDFAPLAGRITIESDRRTVNAGASGEIATVVVVLLGVGVLELTRSFGKAFGETLGKASANALLDWARERGRQQQPLDSPDFSQWPTDHLARGMAGELAELLGVPEERLELVEAARSADLTLRATYRDRENGREYVADVGRDNATFRRTSGPPAVDRRDETP